MRADIAASLALNISRNQASEMIKNGDILIGGKPINKPSFEVATQMANSDFITPLRAIYPSRAAIKLKLFLASLPSDIAPKIDGKTALDIGASAGGFSSILLEMGAKSITALDIGTAQLSKSLRDNPKIIVRENTDIRGFEADKFDLITADLSFISLNAVLNDIARLSNGDIITLFKPQFEVGKDIKRDAKGVLKDTKSVATARKNYELNAAKMGLILVDSRPSELAGKEGNVEYFYYFKAKNG